MAQALRVIEGNRRTSAGLDQDGLYMRAAMCCKPPIPTMHPTNKRYGSCRHGVAG